MIKRKKKKTKAFHTYLSRHECLGNNSAKDNNMTKKIVSMEKETNIISTNKLLYDKKENFEEIIIPYDMSSTIMNSL
jgi:hypothetical protein